MRERFMRDEMLEGKEDHDEIDRMSFEKGLAELKF